MFCTKVSACVNPSSQTHADESSLKSDIAQGPTDPPECPRAVWNPTPATQVVQERKGENESEEEIGHTGSRDNLHTGREREKGREGERAEREGGSRRQNRECSKQPTRRPPSASDRGGRGGEPRRWHDLRSGRQRLRQGSGRVRQLHPARARVHT